MAKLKLVYLVGCVVCLLGVVTPAPAVEPAAPQPYVVLVGISDYKDKQIQSRKHAEADTKALFDVFTNKDYLGVDAGHIRLLLGTPDERRKSEPATRANVLKALAWAAAKAKKTDLVIFAYIGQGAPLGEKTCYLASDSTFTGREKDAISASEVEKALEKMKSEQFCAFIDIYFKGFDPGKKPAPELNLLAAFHELRGKEDEDGRFSSRVLFRAGLGLQPPIDLKEHGLFAQVVLDGLKGKADKEGYEPDGNVTVEELAKYVRKEMTDQIKLLGKTDEQKKEMSFVLERQYANFALTRNPAVAPIVMKRLEKLAELAKTGAVDENTFHQGKDLLSWMPKLKARQSLRKAFQEMVDGKIDAADFAKKRDEILAKTKISPKVATDFAKAILNATRLLKVGYVKETNQGELIAWAIEGLYRRLEETPPPEIKDRLGQAKGMRQSELQALLRDVRVQLGKREDLANGKDVSFTLNPMLGHLDKHSEYTTPEELEQKRIDNFGEYYGIGAHIRQNAEKKMLEIVSPIMGSPAYKAPLYAGDIITTIIREVDSNGKPLPAPEVTSTKGLPIDKAVKLIKGKAGTKVKVIVDRKGEGKPIELTIPRAHVAVETVVGYKRTPNNHWNYYLDKQNKIVYVRLTQQFARSTFRELEKVMKRVTKEGINGMVLDLRGNPGGLLDSAVKISDMFIDDGIIVTVRPRRGQETVYIGKHEDSYLGFPMVCLVNDTSASASEIVSACLQDHHRAVIMGERSYGKGSVQNILPFEPTGGEIKITNATFWRPSNKNLNKTSTPGRDQDEWGVTPDEGFNRKMSPKEQDALYEFQFEQETIRKPGTRVKKPDFKDPHLEMALKYLLGQVKVAAKAEPDKKAG